MKAELRSMKADMSQLVVLSYIYLAILSVSILYVGGVIGIIAIVIWCAFTGIGIISTLFQVFNTRSTSIQIGLYQEDGKGKISMEKYDEYIGIYEKRGSSLIFWVSCLIPLIWVSVFLVADLIILAYIVIGMTFMSELGRYKMYQCVKANKNIWAAAMYVNEIQDLFKKKFPGERK